MNILISGSNGLLGRHLAPVLYEAGHRVIPLLRSRSTANNEYVLWDPATGFIESEKLEDIDAVIHLAGESIFGRWSANKKQRILDSRINSTRLLSETLAQLTDPPSVLISASAVGFYGDREDVFLNEEAASGKGFLASVTRAWEDATTPAREKGIRTVSLRFGVVLSREGGALKTMLLPFRLGLGATIGKGNQYMSWIGLEDVIGVLLHVLETGTLAGPVNAAAPNPVTNRQFTKTLGRVLRRPAVLTLPAFLPKLVFGEMINDLLLASTSVDSSKLINSGYSFHHAYLEDALQSILQY